MPGVWWLSLALLLAPACSNGTASSDAAPAGDSPSAFEGAAGDRPSLHSEGSGNADKHPAANLVEMTSFGSNPGNLRMYKVVPPGLAAPAPLLVVLHGCQLTASSFAVASGWNDLAFARKFLLLYPEQQKSNNPDSCFNWFWQDSSTRDQGEAASIRQAIDKMRADHAVDSKRIFVTGLSAGAAMAADLLADYPDLFAAGAIMAGVPAGCATTAMQAFACMRGMDKTPSAWGDLARAAFPGWSGAWPKVVLFHGSADTLVAYSNLQELIEQWTNLQGTDVTPDVTLTIKGHAVSGYKNSAGAEVVRAYTLKGMGHGIAVDPGNGPEQGGEVAGFAFDVDLWSSYYAAQFFGL